MCMIFIYYFLIFLQVSTDTKTKLEISTLTNVSSVILLTCWEQRVSINVAKWRNRPQTFNRLTEQMFSSSFIFFISRDDCSVTYFIRLSLLICIFFECNNNKWMSFFAWEGFLCNQICQHEFI